MQFYQFTDEHPDEPVQPQLGPSSRMDIDYQRKDDNANRRLHHQTFHGQQNYKQAPNLDELVNERF